MINSRKGFTVLADIMSIIMFFVAVIFVYLLLFRGLIENQIERGVTLEGVSNDAQYFALTLSRTPAPGSLTTPSPGLFPAAVREAAALALNKENEYEDHIKESSYRATLDALFGAQSTLWEGETQRRAVAVYLSVDDKPLWDTCVNYDNPNELRVNALCGWLRPQAIDPETGISVPSRSQDKPEKPLDPLPLTHGFFIVAAEKPVIVHVLIDYETGVRR